MENKKVYLKDLIKVPGTVSNYEYHIEDGSNVEIRIRKCDMPYESVNVHCISIINTTAADPSVVVLCDDAMVKVHGDYPFASVSVFRRNTNTSVSAKRVTNLALGRRRTVYNTICDELIIVYDKYMIIDESIIKNLYSTDKILINGSIIGNANIDQFEMDNQSSIQYVNGKQVISRFTYNEKTIMTTENSFFVNGKGYDLNEKKDNFNLEEMLYSIISNG